MRRRATARADVHALVAELYRVTWEPPGGHGWDAQSRAAEAVYAHLPEELGHGWPGAAREQLEAVHGWLRRFGWPAGKPLCFGGSEAIPGYRHRFDRELYESLR